MSNLDKHHFFLKKKNFTINCSPVIFADAELQLLKTYGNWLQALAYGDILPVSEAQEQFIQVSQRQLPPKTAMETAWYKYQRRRQLEQQKGAQLKQQYKFVDDSFFSRRDC